MIVGFVVAREVFYGFTTNSFPFVECGYVGVSYIIAISLDVGWFDGIYFWTSSYGIVTGVDFSISCTVGLGVEYYGLCTVYVCCYFYNVCWVSNSAAISIYICRIDETILVVFVVCVDVSSCSIYLILFLRFSIL